MKKFLLPSIGDPFNFNYWLKNYDRVWGKEVDGGIVSLLSPIQDDVVEWYRQQCVARGFQFIYRKQERPATHGQSLEVLVQALDYEDSVVILEDDTLFNQSGILDEWFRLLHSGTPVIGSSRNCISPDVISLIHRLYGTTGEVGFQTAFLVIRAAILKDIASEYTEDSIFAQYQPPVGVPLKFLDGHSLDAPLGGDCFDAASLEILSRVDARKIHKTLSYRGAGPDPTIDLRLPFVNIGSLSLGICAIIRDERDIALVFRNIPEASTPGIGSFIEAERKWQFERSLSWYVAFSRSWQHSSLSNFKELYDAGIERFIDKHTLNRQQIYDYASVLAVLG